MRTTYETERTSVSIAMPRGRGATLLLCALATTMVACGDSKTTTDARAVNLRCDPVEQDCNTGLKCNPTGPALGPWTGTTCVADNGATGSPAGTPCFNGGAGTDTCDVTSSCLQFGTGEGACLSYCATTADCDDNTQRCILYDREVGLRLCSLACDLESPSCPRWHECIATGTGAACIPFAWRDGVPR